MNRGSPGTGILKLVYVAAHFQTAQMIRLIGGLISEVMLDLKVGRVKVKKSLILDGIRLFFTL
jgi:hypothetical protein